MVWYDWLSWGGLVLAGVIALTVCGMMLDTLITRWIRRQHYKNNVQETTISDVIRHSDIKEALSRLSETVDDVTGVVIITVKPDNIQVDAVGVGSLEMPAVLGLAAESCLDN